MTLLLLFTFTTRRIWENFGILCRRDFSDGHSLRLWVKNLRVFNFVILLESLRKCFTVETQERHGGMVLERI